MKRNLQIALGLAVGIGLLWLLFHDTDWAGVCASIRNADPMWLVVMQIPIWASFFARVERWRHIVRSTRPVPFRTLFTATQIGFLANFILPLRAGELVRAFVLAQRAGLAFTRGVALVAMDRVADLFGLAACVFFSLLALQRIDGVALPPNTLGNEETLHFAPSLVRAGAGSAFIALALIVAVMVLLYANRNFVLRINDRVAGLVSARLAERTHSLLEQFAHGLQVLRSPTDMVKAILWSLVVWGCFVLATAAALRAFHIDYPWYTPFLIQVLLAIAVSVPGAPGFVGQFHLALIVGVLMSVPSATPDQAKAVAITAHLLNFLPTVLAGFVALLMEHSGLIELTRQSSHAEHETAAEQLD